MRRVHMSHTDLDGEGALVLYHALYDEAEQIRCSYGEMETLIPRTAAELEPGDHLLITDLNLPQSVVDELARAAARGVKIRVLDHHPTTALLAKQWPADADDYLQVRYAERACGTMMLYHYLWQRLERRLQAGADSNNDRGRLNTLSRFEAFVELVNDYDLWLHQHPQSRKLNDLFYLYGRQRFHRRFLVDPNPAIWQSEELILDVEQERKDKYLHAHFKRLQVRIDAEGNRHAVIYADRFISELGHHLLKVADLMYVIMLDPNKQKASIRSRPPFSARKFAEQFKFRGVEGGGVDQAAGFPLDPELLRTMTNALVGMADVNEEATA